ncbi:MAG TPA: SdrD B-like domain-containing protein, partial [Hymenobacter sp.]
MWLLTTQGAWAGSGVQRLQNGNFSRFPIPSNTAYTIAPSNDLGAWRSGVPYVNTGTRPALGSVSIQRAAANYASPAPGTVQNPFPGDAANSVPASSTWLLYRGNATSSSAPASIWFQNVSVRPGTTYVFSYYASNANAPGTSNAAAPNVPVLQFQLNNVAQGANVTLANEPVNGDVWTRYTYTFTAAAGQTSVELRLVDLATGSVGDQLALTGLSLRTPSASAGASFSCDGSLYQMRQVNTAAINGFTGNSTRLFEVIRSTTPYTTNEIEDLGGSFNAAGYNSSNGYIYCLTYTGNVNPTGTDPQVDRATDPTSVVELNKIGVGGIESLGTVAGLPVDQWTGGTVDRGSTLYLKAQSNTSVIYKIDLNATPLVASALNTSVAFTAYDLAYSPTNNLLYATSFPGQIYIVNPTTGAVTQAGNTPDNTQALGTAFFDVAGNLYAYGNGPAAITATSGRFYLINKTTGAATLINNINGASNSDGASCINPSQRIDVVKRATNVVSVSATQFDVTYVIQVKNTGTITDANVQVSDLLRGNANNTTFPTSTAVALQGSIAVVNHDGSTLAPNAGFTGVSGGASLLTGTQALTAGQRATITYTVRVTFPAGSVPATAQNNTAYATSTTTSPNNGYTQAADGTLLSPFDLVANDASTNGSTLPPSRTGLNDTGDSPSPTPVTFQPAISGNIFEDVNYGGGAGRAQAASQGIGRGSVRVELYTGSGSGATFSAFTTTDATGNYAFTGLTAGSTYTVRVPNNAATAVSSSRPGSTGGLLPVPTYVYNNANRVGGENPGRTDAGNGTAGTTLGSLSTAPVGSTPGTVAQSIATVTLPAGNLPVLNVDFGFNFDVVTNTNNSGQGSLRQFINNANALGGEASLTQSGSNGLGALPAGKETSIFMIPDGVAHPGLSAYNAATNPGLISQLSAAGVALIAPATALPA